MPKQKKIGSERQKRKSLNLKKKGLESQKERVRISNIYLTEAEKRGRMTKHFCNGTGELCSFVNFTGSMIT